MKRFIRFVCFFLVFATLAAVPTFAQAVEPRASRELSSYGAYCTMESSTSVMVVFRVIGATALDEIGVNTVKIQYSSDGVNWSTAKTFRKADYPELIDHNTAFHGCALTGTVPSGMQYRAYVEFYGKKGSNFTERTYYTSVI